ncbi:hypothetical protein ACGF5T_17635 [Streptomyces sp. NPDC047853]|uniref:hypothetical protein n=1 Tax=unclassified Streptomyces TaxID=2593676 RepID=UPI0034546C9B
MSSALAGLAVVWPWLASHWGRLWGAGGPGSGEAGGPAGRKADGLGRRARAAVIALPAVALAVALLPSTGAVERDPALRPAASAAEADR